MANSYPSPETQKVRTARRISTRNLRQSVNYFRSHGHANLENLECGALCHSSGLAAAEIRSVWQTFYYKSFQRKILSTRDFQTRGNFEKSYLQMSTQKTQAQAPPIILCLLTILQGLTAKSVPMELLLKVPRNWTRAKQTDIENWNRIVLTLYKFEVYDSIQKGTSNSSWELPGIARMLKKGLTKHTRLHAGPAILYPNLHF